MITIEKLKEYGANTEEGLARCMDNEAFYLKLVAMIPSEGNFEKLADSLKKNDLDSSFEAAHALKGVVGNLALTPLYEPLSEITELLRARKDIDYSEMIAVIISKRDELKDLLE